MLPLPCVGIWNPLDTIGGGLVVRHPSTGGETHVQFLVWPDFESQYLARAASCTALQSSLFNPPLRHYSIKASQPLILGLTSHHNYSSPSVSATPSSQKPEDSTLV